MDPNENLKEQLELVKEILAEGGCDEPDMQEMEHKSIRLAELIEALDGWIRKGGFLPKAWAGE